jgi:hypothetical protein
MKDEKKKLKEEEKQRAAKHLASPKKDVNNNALFYTSKLVWCIAFNSYLMNRLHLRRNRSAVTKFSVSLHLL